MKTDKNTNKKTSSDAGMPFDADTFIQQVSGTGSWEDTPASVQTNNQADSQAEMPEPIEEKPSKRKRSQTVDYKTLFLSRNELRDRQGLYIARDHYKTLQTLVRAISNERLSVSGLVDNIVKHHIELYGDGLSCPKRTETLRREDTDNPYLKRL